MSEKITKTKSDGSKNIETVVSKPKKEKHNSKRRKSKKNCKMPNLDNDSKTKKVDEVVNFLCSSISKNESDTSLETNLHIKIAKESPKDVNVCFSQNCNCNLLSFCATYFPSTSKAKLSNLLENFQLHASNNLKKSSISTEFFNIDLLKNTDYESLFVEDLENLKVKMSHKTANKTEDKIIISNESFKGCFNSVSVQKFINKNVNNSMDSNSMQISEVRQFDCSSSSDMEENSSKNKHLKKYFKKEYFNINAFMKINDSLESSGNHTSKLLVNDLSKITLRNETLEKRKHFEKEKCKNMKKKIVITGEEEEVLDKNENHFLMCRSCQKKNSPEPTSSALLQSIQNTKRQDCKKIPNNDMKFPEYFCMEKLKSLSNFGILLSGIIRINQKNYKEAYITAPDKGMDILIEGLKDRNRALEGDEVYFVLKPKEHHRTSNDSTEVQRTAVVVGIKTLNHNRGAIGTLNVIKNKNVNFALFSPRDSRLPRIRIKKSNCPAGFFDKSEDFKDILYFAKILQWNDLRFADGEIVKEIGAVGDIEAETDAILLKYELDVTPYSENLKQFIPPCTFKISEDEIKNREDLRKDCIFTIDPATAKDLDDAVSCKILSNGNYEIGVHISDVSYFLTEGTPLDLAVCKRATTIYLVQKTFHMLPFELCQICSLTPGEDKLAFSVMWEITPDYKIIGHRFARTVINSCAQFAYEQIQLLINDSNSSNLIFPKIFGCHTAENIKKIVLFLHQMAMNLKNKRFGNGALRIDQKKIRFSLDENCMPINYIPEAHEESHQLIEEFMLLANVTVAESLNDFFPKIAFLRAHSPPLLFILEKIQKNLEKYGIILNISTSGSLQNSLLKYSGVDFESIARSLVLNNIISKPMARAKYYCGGFYPNEADRRHYALNVPLYTHFTSPIRRYADIMTHRLLAASLQFCNTPNWTIDHVQSIASNCNKQKYAAKMAGEMSTELFLTIYIGLKGGVVFEAVVCDIKDKSFDCIILSTGAHQRLYFEHIKGHLYQEQEDGIFRLIVKWPKDEKHKTETIQIIEMFSIIKVELKRANASVLKIEANLLRYE